MLNILDFITEHGPKNYSKTSHWHLLLAFHWISKKKKKKSVSQSKLNVKCFKLRDWTKKIPNLFSVGVLALESISSYSILKFGYGF